jgi:hypothetical protein
MGSNTTAYGIYGSRSEVEAAIDRFRNEGFRLADISVLFPENIGNKDLAVEKDNKMPEGAAVGASSGGLLGGILGLLAGAGTFAIPGIGPFIAAGPLMTTLSGIAAGGFAGGLTGAMIGAGIPEYEAKRYAGRIDKGGILMSVHCDDSEWTAKAKDLLCSTGAEDVSSTGEAKGDFQNTEKPFIRTGSDSQRLTHV